MFDRIKPVLQKTGDNNQALESEVEYEDSSPFSE